MYDELYKQVIIMDDPFSNDHYQVVTCEWEDDRDVPLFPLCELDWIYKNRRWPKPYRPCSVELTV